MLFSNSSSSPDLPLTLPSLSLKSSCPGATQFSNQSPHCSPHGRAQTTPNSTHLEAPSSLSLPIRFAPRPQTLKAFLTEELPHLPPQAHNRGSHPCHTPSHLESHEGKAGKSRTNRRHLLRSRSKATFRKRQESRLPRGRLPLGNSQPRLRGHSHQSPSPVQTKEP